MGLSANFANEPVLALALRPAITIEAAATVREAVEKMREQQLGCVFVVDAHGRPVGMFNERILIQLLDENPQALDDSVARYLEKRCDCVREDEAIGSVLYKVESDDKRFVGVVDSNGRLTALTGEKGILEFVAEHFPRQVMVARPGMPRAAQCEGA
jgi:CBS domain-containing protein